MSKRNLSKTYKKQIAKKAIKLKKENPELTLASIAERFTGISGPSHLKNIITWFHKEAENERKKNM